MNLLTSMRYLVALNEHRHFGRAAQVCHITQPALSNALRALEQEFEVLIVKRDRNFAGLTPEGEQVLASAQLMLHEHRVLQESLRCGVESPKGTLRLAAVPTAMPILSRFAAQLQLRHPGIVPVVLSMSSKEIEQGLDELSVDLALGYIERLALLDKAQGNAKRLQAIAQYLEHYYLLRRAKQPDVEGLQIGEPIGWKQAAALPLCLLTPDMHNRTLVDNAFAQAGAAPTPRMETNSILTLALSVVAGGVCSVMPGALVDAVRGYRELEALPLVGPVVQTPIGFLSSAVSGSTRALQAAQALAQESDWLDQVTQHSGALQP